MENKGYNFEYHVNTIRHLGSQMYNDFPSLIGELLSNSYDAEATEVKIEIDYDKKIIKVIDNGHGMSFKDLNDEYLVIGRNRRENSNNGGMSKNNKRFVTGKKGLGKLAVFGVANRLKVSSVCCNKKNSFLIDYKELMGSNDNSYKPEALLIGEKTEEENGTIIEISDITQKTITFVDVLANNLSRRFNFFSEDFKVKIIGKKEEYVEEKEVNIELFYSQLESEFEWKFPEDFESGLEDNIYFQYLVSENITGKIIAGEKPLPTTHRGFITYARNKMASIDRKYDDSPDDYYNNYFTGYFHADFIDEDNTLDVISTNRRSIRWESYENTLKLKSALNVIVKKAGTFWRKERAKKKDESLNKELGDKFFDGLTPSERKNIKKIKTTLLQNTLGEANIEQLAMVLDSVKTAYVFESFREYIDDLSDMEITKDNILKIANDWEMIESKELAKVALGRISAIEKLEQHLEGNAKEVEIMQPFFEKFPWILNPRITTFEREVSFSTILKKNFPDQSLGKSNRRIDFLCSLTNGKLIIIELKRPNIKISQKEIEQALSYKLFVEKHHVTAISNGVETYLISDRYDMDEVTNVMVNGLSKSGTLKILSYSDLLVDARKYNQEMIDMYERIKNLRKQNE